MTMGQEQSEATLKWAPWNSKLIIECDHDPPGNSRIDHNDNNSSDKDEYHDGTHNNQRQDIPAVTTEKGLTNH